MLPYCQLALASIPEPGPFDVQSIWESVLRLRLILLQEYRMIAQDPQILVSLEAIIRGC